MSTTLNLSNFKPTFDDEFNSFTSSPTGGAGTWQTTFYFGGRTLSSNGEQEFYSDSSVGVNPFSLQNGALQITASPGSNPAGLPYNSGLITTEGEFTQTYGYFEMRAKLPAGQGLWPAFWLLPADKSWPPELDPLEAFGATNANGEGGANKIHVGEISSNSWQSNGSWITTPANITTGYHSYGVDWESDHVTYYFDGQQVAQFNTPADMNKPMYMLANLAAGGTWPGGVGGESGQLSIDYIRAYSSDAGAKAVAMQTISSPDGAATAATVATTAAAVSSAPLPSPIQGAGGQDTLTLHVSADRFLGDPQFTVKVDGVQLGGTQSTDAAHGQGLWDDITLTGNFGIGAHQVDVTFVNDAWDGTGVGDGHDRNLYVGSISLDGQTYQAGSSGTLMANGVASFHTTIAGSSSPATTPSPAAAASPMSASSADSAQATPDVARSWIQANSQGVATGGAAAADLFNTAGGQTLVGNGGNDLFHLGSHADTSVVEHGSGISTVAEWALQYTLADGIANLQIQGNYAQLASGNASANWITAGSGNDFIDGGGGNDTIVAGVGASILTGGVGKDTFAFPDVADQGNHVTDFTPGQDLLDLRSLMKSAGYGGADPVTDNILHLVQSGSDTKIVIDPHGNGDWAAHTVVTLDHILPSAVKVGTDLIWH
jgi:beta-glucanase (GH16 family)